MNEIERPDKVVIPQELKHLFDWYREEIVRLKKENESLKKMIDVYEASYEKILKIIVS